MAKMWMTAGGTVGKPKTQGVLTRCNNILHCDSERVSILILTPARADAAYAVRCLLSKGDASPLPRGDGVLPQEAHGFISRFLSGRRAIMRKILLATAICALAFGITSAKA